MNIDPETMRKLSVIIDKHYLDARGERTRLFIAQIMLFGLLGLIAYAFGPYFIK